MSCINATGLGPNARRRQDAADPAPRPEEQAQVTQAPGFSRQMLKLSAEAMVTQIR
jgi:hypothetical protein